MLPGHADVADAVSHVAAAREALLHRPMWSLTAALGPDSRGQTTGQQMPADGWVLCFHRLYNLKKKKENTKIRHYEAIKLLEQKDRKQLIFFILTSYWVFFLFLPPSLRPQLVW